LSDKLIDECMQAISAKFRDSNGFEVWTAYVGSSADLDKVNEVWASQAMTSSPATSKVGMYFVWGCNNDLKPGYVLHTNLLQLMERMESVGIVTRYPNHSQLYKAITSKEYQALLCTNPRLAIPPTVSTCSALWLSHPEVTSQRASEALSLLKSGSVGKPVLEGVVKVGYEWMGDGVRAFSGLEDMQAKALGMFDGSHGRPPVVLVQERIKNIACEPRVFVFNGLVKGIRYTWNQKHNPETGRIHALRTCPQSRAAQERFEGDVQAQQYVEKRIAELVKEWNAWLVAASGEPPVFVRIDFLVEKLFAEEDIEQSAAGTPGDESWTFPEDSEDKSIDFVLPSSPMTEADLKYADKYRVWTCELGEIGSSMVGFKEGRSMLFEAIAESCVVVPKKPRRPAPKLPQSKS
jgi:hypothetical protein